MAVTIQEVMQTLKEDVLRDFSTPGLFSDRACVNAINQAHNLFARRTHCYIETNLEIALAVGASDYVLAPRVIHVYNVYDSAGAKIPPYMRRQQPRSRPGARPQGYSTDTTSRTIRVWPVPSGISTITLDVAVLPERAVLDPVWHELELDEQYVDLLLEWAAYKLLRNNDADASQTISAESFKAAWEEGLTEAKRDFFRERHGESIQLLPAKWVI